MITLFKFIKKMFVVLYKKPFLFLVYFVCSVKGPIVYAQTRPDRIDFAIVQEWGHFNPVTVNLASTRTLLSFVVRPLFQFPSDANLESDLAEKIPSLKDKSAVIKRQNGKQYIEATWKIRSEAKWGDGMPVVCEDLKLAWEIGSHANVSVDERTLYRSISDVRWDVKDPKSCIVSYVDNSWTFDRTIPAPIPAHLERAVFEKHKNTPLAYDQSSNYVTNPTLPGLYNGPFVVAEFKLGSHLRLVRNNFDFSKTDGSNKITTVVIHLVTDTNQLKARLASKSIQGVFSSGFPQDQALGFADSKEAKSGMYRVNLVDSPAIQGLFMNLSDPVFADAKVRHALSKMIDKEKLTQAFFAAKLKAAYTFVPPMHPVFKNKYPNSYDPRAAQQLLTEAGWKKNSSGVFEKNGKQLELVFRTSAGIRVLEQVQAFICDQFQKSGVLCVIKNLPPRALLGDAVPKGEFQLSMFGFPVFPDVSLKSLFMSTEIPTAEKSWAGANTLRIKSKSIDAILNAFDSEPDRDKRNQLMSKLEKEIMDSAMLIPLYHRKEAFIVPTNLRGFELDVSGFYVINPGKLSF